MQGIVFKANYLAYVDDIVEQWISATLAPEDLDYMVKKAAIEWDSPARRGDVLDLTAEVSRWGRTSFDLTVTGAVDGRSVFTATLLCVNVTLGTHTPAPISDKVKAALSRS